MAETFPPHVELRAVASIGPPAALRSAPLRPQLTAIVRTLPPHSYGHALRVTGVEVRAEISCILLKDQIRHLKQTDLWSVTTFVQIWPFRAGGKGTVAYAPS